MRDYEVTSREEGWRLDIFVLEKAPNWVSRSMVQKAIKEGKILVNGKKKKPSYKVKKGETIQIDLPEKPSPITVKPEEIEIPVLYEDKDIIVVNKPPGMIVHPVPSHTSGTLVNALLNICKDLQGIKGDLRPGIVHRLDKDTSGVMVVAKNDLAHMSLSKQFKERMVEKTYLAIVKGFLKNDEGIIDMPLARHPVNRVKMAVLTDGREAITFYKVLRRFKDIATFLLVNPKTGRTHQIRVHMKYIGHPILGDKIYGKHKQDEMLGVKRQMLHALALSFYHPRKGDKMKFIAPIPDDFKEVLKKLHELSEAEK
ncbi:MAG TPA: RluA family pseudouridine synthase [Thermotoga sp.]|nr:RluA family pseudouridine synthase [Thermotoga sp.]